ncbi:MAG: XrtA system polysaccharide deacetylase [Gemmatimonadota bacterium]
MNGLPSAREGHVFTVDVEEYFQVSAFEGAVSRREWDGLPSRVEANVELLLGVLAEYGVHATFFTLGWIAEKHPTVVRRIAAAGHEVASHGWWHRRLTGMESEEFRLEIRRTKQILEGLAGRPVYGHRAPSFSVVPGTEWAFDILLEEGYRYDSSVFPIRRLGYGYPGAEPGPHVVTRPGGRLLELPLATTRWAGLRLPAAGGAYFRVLPFGLTRRAFAEHTREGRCGVFYLHPWELDPDQPRLRVSPLARGRHYLGLAGTLRRLHLLLGRFRFTSVERRFGLGEVGAAARVSAPLG